VGRANLPWIVYWNYKEKYATNPIIDILRDKPYEHRVQMLPFRGHERCEWLRELYGIEWVQHLFQYYNIQCLDVIQAPREANDNIAFRKALPSNNPATLLRLWQLTNTRYLLGMGGPFVDALNQQLDPGQRRFRLQTPFELAPKGTNAVRPTDLTAVLSTNGSLGLIEFTGALPRARLYPQWQVVKEGDAALKKLADPAFDPWQTVLVENEISPPTVNATNAASGRVEFASYAPKVLQLKADATAPSVLLLNDRYDPDWKVKVDGREQPLLRCNFLMRGVHIQPGQHTVEFRYEPPTKGFFVSVGAIVAALGLCGVLAISSRDTKPRTDLPSATDPQPPPRAAPAATSP